VCVCVCACVCACVCECVCLCACVCVSVCCYICTISPNQRLVIAATSFNTENPTCSSHTEILSSFSVPTYTERFSHDSYIDLISYFRYQRPRGKGVRAVEASDPAKRTQGWGILKTLCAHGQRLTIILKTQRLHT